MNVDLSFREIQTLLESLQEKRLKVLQGTHVGHFPDGVTRVADLAFTNVQRYCHNDWCPLGQVNIITDRLEKARDEIQSRMMVELQKPGHSGHRIRMVSKQ